MRIILEIGSQKEIMLPLNYNHIVQGFLYNNLSDKEFREFIHTQGYQIENKKFKLFTYSRLQGTFKIYPETKEISFAPPVKLVISSVVQQFISDLAETSIKADSLDLGKNKVSISSISVEKQFPFSQNVQIKMLSPLVAYTTDNKFTQYYSPWHPQCNEILTNNLIDKYKTIFGYAPSDQTFKITPNGMQEKKFKIIANYKNTIIEGYNGIYHLKGNPELIEVAYNTGLGSKNSQGFGCWEVVR